MKQYDVTMKNTAKKIGVALCRTYASIKTSGLLVRKNVITNNW